MRRPSVGRLIAMLTAVTVVLLLSIDTTMACRFLWRHRICDPAPLVARCVAAAPSSTCCAPPVDCCAPAPVVGDCCGSVITGEFIPGGYSTDGVIIGESYSGGETIISETPIESAEPAPVVAEPAKATEATEAVEPAAAEEEADDDDAMPEDDMTLPGDDADDVLPGDDTLPADDDSVFDSVDEPAEADAPAFEEPADALPEDMPADDLDAFSAPSDVPEADVPADDDALPGFDEPAVEPDAAPADGEGDSLDDLFGAADSATDIEPRTARQPEELPAADDLFDAPTENAAPAEKSTVDDLDDLFGFREVTPAPVTTTVSTEIERPEFRVWTDNTGRYQTVGKLVKISDTHVRLLKDNNRFSTVSKDRLSQADLAYIDQHAKSMGVESFDRVASR